MTGRVYYSLYDRLLHEKPLFEAFKRVKTSKGKGGIDHQEIEDFEVDLSENIQTLVKELKDKTYVPLSVKRVEISKGNGKVRKLGISTIADRIAQMVAKIYFEPLAEPYFLQDSNGYRPNKSAIDAVAVTRKRCWRYNWVLEFDIKGLFDNIDHELLM